MDKETYKQKLYKTAEILKALGHPARLCIVCRLMLKDYNVSHIQDCLELPQSTVSQHLAILKAKGIIKGQRKGVEVIYSIANDDVKKIINALFEPEVMKALE